MGSDSGKDSGSGHSKAASNKPNKSASFFDNFAEDLGNLVSGRSTSPHSAYDERNAKAMSRNNGGDTKDYLPGGKYGPGGGSYSPSDLHQAGIEQSRSVMARERELNARAERRQAQIGDRAQRAQRAQTGLLGGVSETLGRQTLGLGGSVGLNGQNARADVTRVQSALVDRGHLDEVTGYGGTKMVDATKAFQERQGLTVDGRIAPGGETEAALARSIVKSDAKSAILSGTRSSAHPSAPLGSSLAAQLSAAQAAMARGGDTVAEQARNIERHRALREKYADAVAQANQAAARARQTAKDYVAGQAAAGAAPRESYQTAQQRKAARGARPTGPAPIGIGWDAARQQMGHTFLDMQEGVYAIAGLDVDQKEQARRRARVNALLSPEQRRTTPAKVGTFLGGGLTTAAKLSGLGGIASSAGQAAQDARAKGASPNEIGRAARHAGLLDLGLGKFTQGITKGYTALAKTMKNPSLSARALFGSNPLNAIDELGAGANLLAEGALDALIDRVHKKQSKHTTKGKD